MNSVVFIYINSVNRVNHGCNPSALLIGPIINAKLISEIFDNSIEKMRINHFYKLVFILLV
jgi:hypothetical protein